MSAKEGAAERPSPMAESQQSNNASANINSFLSSDEIRELLSQDHSLDSLHRLQDDYHRIPPQFREQVISYFSEALNEHKEGTKIGNEIMQFLRSILPKGKIEKNNSTKPVEFAERILGENHILTFGEKSKRINISGGIIRLLGFCHWGGPFSGPFFGAHLSASLLRGFRCFSAGAKSSPVNALYNSKSLRGSLKLLVIRASWDYLNFPILKNQFDGAPSVNACDLHYCWRNPHV